MDNDFKDQIKKELERLKVRRMYQMDYTPGSVKNAALGEANSYIFDGNTANRPTVGASVSIGTNVYYDYQTKKLYIWNRLNNAWDYVQFT